MSISRTRTRTRTRTGRGTGAGDEPGANARGTHSLGAISRAAFPSGFLGGVGVIFSLEMRQRVRGVAWYVLLGVFFALILLVTVLLSVAVNYAVAGPGGTAGAIAYSTIIYFVLLLGSLVAPALSGNAINGDRDSGTLATTQVTLVSHWQIVLGKLLAAWVTALAFLVTALPFLLFTMFAGVPPLTVLVSIVVLAVELGVVSAIGVGLSGIISRPLFSIVVTYLVVAALSVGTLIAFSLGGFVLESHTTTRVYSSTQADASGNSIRCSYQSTVHEPVPRFDRVWGILAANPYVLLADAVPTSYDQNGNPVDLFGYIKLAERSAQIPPKLSQTQNDCALTSDDSGSGARDVIDSTTPGWLVGLIVQFALAIAAIWGAAVRLRTPARRLPKGTRIA